MTKDIKAVIFDWGGVLIDDPGPELMQYCARKLNVTSDEFINSFERFYEDFQINSFSEDEFWELMYRDLNIEKPSEVSLWKKAFKAVYKPKDEMFRLVNSLRAKGYKTAILSNTEMPAIDFFIEQRYNYFDVQVFSCIEGTRKPDREIYEITLKKLCCKPNEAVFIDDKPPMVEGGKKVGLNTIHFKSIEQVKTELTRLGLDLK
jgi:epoxide hydrolase-like predicted phosphatase